MKTPVLVRTFGRIESDPYHFSPGTKDGDMMLILNIEGKGVYKNKKKRIELKPEMVLLIEPEDPGVIYSDKNEPYDHVYCRFNGAYAFYLVERIIDEKKSSCFSYSGIGNLISRMNHLPYVIRKDLPMYMEDYELMLVKILMLLLNENTIKHKKTLTLHDLNQYIVSHLGELNDLEKMAKYFKMSKPALCRSAKKLLGDTIVNASNKIRIEQACSLLKMNVMNVREVARRVGFEDQFYFSKVFKNICDLSPKQWQLKNSVD